jgi:hypothetical protein
MERMMNFKYYIYVVSDNHGNKKAAVCSETWNVIQFFGMKDKNGNIINYESDASDVLDWCENYGLTCDIKEMSTDL